MSMTSDGRLPFGGSPRLAATDRAPLGDDAARRAAVDPAKNVVLEASAGTGKTRVLVDRYVNLLRAGVEPENILAVTFTRKAAAEMRQRIVDTLRQAASQSPADAARWRGLRDRLNEIAISTIDAFCLSLLREFPLEADLDPDFDVADETEIPRLVEAALDDTLRICRARARTDEGIALLFAQLGDARVRLGLAALLERRIVAESVLKHVTAMGPRDLTVETACTRGVARTVDALNTIPGGLDRFIDAGPVHHPRYAVLAADLRQLAQATVPGGAALDPARLKGIIDRLRAHFFTKAGTPRKRPSEYRAEHFATPGAGTAYWPLITAAAMSVDGAIRALRRDLNAIQSRAVWQVFSIASRRYRQTLEAHGVLDFSELLVRATSLLGNMDEFARSRYLLEARYHHVLVDEFQDTSRAQWALVSLLVRAWGEGAGLAAEAPLPPSIFIVGDRKQSIYRFRDADVRVLDEAADAIGQLRPGETPVRSISHSFRSVPPLLAFANDLFREVAGSTGRPDAFRFGEGDAFPVEPGEPAPGDEPALGLIASAHVRVSAQAVAAEIARLVAGAEVRDRQTGLRRPIRPADIGILFRSRESHREFERALEARRIPAYVYKGLGFFDADEIKDVVALLRYVAEPTSDLRAAALLRSRFVRLSDAGVQRLAPSIARALTERQPPPCVATLDAEDARVFDRLRSSLVEWLDLTDRVPPAELLDRALSDSAYEFEIRGARLVTARENLKKIRGLIRRVQNRGYLTLARLAGVLDRLSTGDESNAVVDAIDAVNLMTVHAAKGLEFPVVFVVNVSRGAGGAPSPIRIDADAPSEDAVAVGDFQTEFDEHAEAREREETRRLLYVAVTRGRDRVYLASVVADGKFKPGPGSLGEVLPPAFQAMFAEAAHEQADGATVRWHAAAGTAHTFRVCVPPAEPPPGGPAPPAGAIGEQAGSGAAVAADDFDQVTDPGGRPRVAVTAIDAGAAPAGPGRDAARQESTSAAGVILGRVVHRMFQRSLRGDAEDPVLADAARALINDDERQAVGDRQAFARRAAAMFAGMWAKSEVRSALDGAECLYEVPVSFTRHDPIAGTGHAVLRGVIDCLARRPDGRVIVLDFKTGAKRQADERQLAAYVQAARHLFPGAPVEGLLVYPA
jgi:ATP-dependent helicase/nuclease subunit A